MSTPATARHRASLRPATPLSTLSTAVTEGVGTIGRSGVVIAMSSGLVATLGLPAQAVGSSTAGAGTVPNTSPNFAPVAALSRQEPLSGSRAAQQLKLRASPTATITFERPAFAAAPRTRPKASVLLTPTPRGERTGGSSRKAAPVGKAAPIAKAGKVTGGPVLSVAARYLGVPYVYGGDGPGGWDCSGAVRYIFGQIGVSLPRTSGAQYAATHPISGSEAMAGDLVFFFSGGRVSHVSIYAGNGMIYDSGRSGSRFSKRAIWSSNIAFTRVTG